MFKTQHHQWTDIRKQAFNHIHIYTGSQSQSETIEWYWGEFLVAFWSDLGDRKGCFYILSRVLF